MNTFCPSRASLRSWLRQAGRGALGAAVFALLPALGHAQYTTASEAVSADDRAALAQMARAWVEPALQSALEEAPQGLLRPEVVMGALDSRLRLAPCQRIEPYLPPGTRLWGRSRIGLRCLEGPVHWNVFVPLVVKAWGPAWVLRRSVPGGTALAQEDADQADIDWAAHPSAVLATPESWLGQQAAFALQAGQPLRANMVRPTPVFPRGAQVRVKSIGSGFHVVANGEALDAGVEGQAARVKLSNGQVVTGTVRPGQVVEVKL